MSAVPPGFVVAVAGRPGAGKSTLCAALARRLGCASVVEWDAYETLTARPPDAIRAWLDAGADPAEATAPGLVEAIHAASSQGSVVFEAPFGRAHPQTAGLIDLLAWIDAPPDVALARKLRQLLTEPQGLDPAWLEGYLAAYEAVVRPSCQIQLERVRPQADIVLSAEASPEAEAARIARLIFERTRPT